MLKSTGIVRKLDELGRIVIPIELRRTLSMKEQDAIEIYTDGHSVILKKYEPGCKKCGAVGVPLRGDETVLLCDTCIADLGRQAGIR